MKRKLHYIKSNIFKIMVFLAAVFSAVALSGIGKGTYATDYKTVTTADGLILEEHKRQVTGEEYYLIGYTDKLGTDLVIPDYYNGHPVVEISSEAFMGNTKLKTLTVPETVCAIRSRAFKDCTALESVTFTGDCRAWKDQYYSEASSHHIYLCNEAFMNCTALTYFELPYGGECPSIDRVFEGSGIKKLKLVWGTWSSLYKMYEAMPELEVIDIIFNDLDSSAALLGINGLAELPKLREINVYNFDQRSRHGLGIDFGSQSISRALLNCPSLKIVNVYCSDKIVGNLEYGFANVQNYSSDTSVIEPSDRKISGYEVKILGTGTADLTCKEADFTIRYIIGEAEDKKSLADAKAVLPVDSFTYTGDAIEPYVLVTYGKNVLVEDIDYSCEFTENKKIGTATAVLKGKGDYSGELTLNFSIIPPETAVRSIINANGKYSLAWNKRSQADGYQIYYSSKKTKGYKKLYSGPALKTDTTKLKSGMYIKVRTYKKVGKTTYYSEWSVPVQVK